MISREDNKGSEGLEGGWDGMGWDGMRTEDKDRKRPHRKKEGRSSDAVRSWEKGEAGSKPITVQVQTYFISSREMDQAQWTNQRAAAAPFAPTERYCGENATDVEIMLMSGTAPALISAQCV